MPVPASRIVSGEPGASSVTHGVLPPVRAVAGPDTGMLPRVPQKVRVTVNVT
jgi:hypothetical protein